MRLLVCVGVCLRGCACVCVFSNVILCPADCVNEFMNVAVCAFVYLPGDLYVWLLVRVYVCQYVCMYVSLRI